MLAKLIIDPNLDSRIIYIAQNLQEYNVKNPHPDLLYFLAEEKLGVEQTKQIRSHLSIKPVSSKNKFVVLESADNLTPDAQNSLLKTLEEPPESAVIILGAASEDSFLPTVLSRCQVIKVARVKSLESRGNKEIDELIKKDMELRFQFVEKLEDKDGFLEDLAQYFKIKLEEDPKTEYVEFLKVLMTAQKWTKNNVSIRPILEYLMLKLPEN